MMANESHVFKSTRVQRSKDAPSKSSLAGCSISQVLAFISVVASTVAVSRARGVSRICVWEGLCQVPIHQPYSIVKITYALTYACMQLSK